jgi:PilX N-terminal
MKTSHLQTQRGAAALIVVLMLLFAATLVTLYANRNLVFEQRTAANQYHAVQAFEAAEAGVEWALAQLNANRRIGADCLPSTDPAATSFRSRYLILAPRTGVLTPKPALQASCVRAGEGWLCSCPTSGAPNLLAPTGSTPAAAFTIQLLPTHRPGVVRVVANGCTGLAGACLAGSTTRADASAKVDVAIALGAGLRTPPAATVTVRGAFDAGRATIGLHNADPATGNAVDAGGAIVAPQARLTAPAGGSTSASLAADDASLAALSADHFFASHFGVDKATWKAQPAVTRMRCSGDCSAALGHAIEAAADGALIHIDGDLAISGPATLGSAQRPIAIVVEGAARFEGAVALIGVLHAASIEWNATAGGAFVRGALLAEGGYRGNGAPELSYDAAVLDALRHGTGSFARVAGSWRDF